MEAVRGYVFDLINFYDRLWELRDPRVENLPLMSGPLPTVVICLTYVYIVTIFGPNFMRDRKPIEIRDGANAFLRTRWPIWLQTLTNTIQGGAGGRISC